MSALEYQMKLGNSIEFVNAGRSQYLLSHIVKWKIYIGRPATLFLHGFLLPAPQLLFEHQLFRMDIRQPFGR